MTCRIRKGFQAEIGAKGFGVTKIFAESLEDLDAEVDAYLERLEDVRERRSAAILARLAGVQRAAYRAVREALNG